MQQPEGRINKQILGVKWLKELIITLTNYFDNSGPLPLDLDSHSLTT